MMAGFRVSITGIIDGGVQQVKAGKLRWACSAVTIATAAGVKCAQVV
jgi:hypothetical protein